MVPPTVGWVLLHQLTISTVTNGLHSTLLRLSFQVIQSCAKLTSSTENKVQEPPSLLAVRPSYIQLWQLRSFFSTLSQTAHPRHGQSATEMLGGPWWSQVQPDTVQAVPKQEHPTEAVTANREAHWGVVPRLSLVASLTVWCWQTKVASITL